MSAMKGRNLLTLLLALTLLCGCAASGGDGRNIFFTRAATDEEAFSHSMGEEEVIVEDEAVPLAGLPAAAAAEEETEEGWLLVRYAQEEDGSVTPLWYRVWTEEGCWSQETLPYEGTGWQPVLPEPEVRPLG